MRFILLILAVTFSAAAFGGQNADAVRKAIDDFLTMQTQGMPGQASYSIGTLTNTERLPACDQLNVAVPRGGKLWGRCNVVVSCVAPRWSLYVPVTVKVFGSYIVASRALRQGQTIAADDVGVQQGDLAELPAGTLTDVRQAVGRTLAFSLGAGQPLRGDAIRLPVVVQQNQTVKVVSHGTGFSVSNEGVALNNATVGQVVRVRLENGQLVSGVADDSGNVVVAY